MLPQVHYKALMDYDPLPISEDIITKVTEVMAMLKGMERDKVGVRLIKDELKPKEPYKIFVYKKPEVYVPPINTNALNSVGASADALCRHNPNAAYNNYNGHYPYNDFVFSMEDATGETAEKAISKFFDDMQKSAEKTKKMKERDFAKSEKDLAAINYILNKIDNFKKEL